MSTGTWQAGTEFVRGARAARLASNGLLALLVLAGCQLAEQPGDERLAAAAALDFLGKMADGRVAETWAILTPATRAQIYKDDADEFAADVASADWSSLSWQVGPVSNLDISWGVYVEVLGGPAPDFLTEREIAGTSSEGDLFLLIQLSDDGSYAVAGQAMDSEPP